MPNFLTSMGRRSATSRARRYTALLSVVCGAAWALTLALDAPSATWSIVDPDGASAVRWDGAFVEKCSLDQLHLRVDAVVDVAALRAHQHSHGARVSAEIVRVDQHDDVVVAMQRIELQVWDDVGDNDGDNDDDPDTTTTRATLQQATDDPAQAAVECAFDAAFCVPKIVGIRLPDVVGDGDSLRLNHSIVLQFADATNEPDARSRDAVDAFVAFPTYVGDAMEGNWTDAKTLVLTVTALDEAQVLPLQQLMAALVHTTLRIPEKHNAPQAEETPRRVRVQGDVRLRIEPEGEFIVRVALADPVSDVVSPIVRVRRCASADTEASSLILVLKKETLASASALQSQQDAEAVSEIPEPVVFIDGVLSHSGEESFTLHHSAIQMQKPGSWSLNFWLFTDQDSTGQFRTLFFNGDGTGQHRTPSAWFRPDDRRLVLRVSTAENMDVGLDSVSEIPRDEWVNIGATMKNCSTGVDDNSTVRPECEPPGDDSKPWFYSMKLFVNGNLDQEVRIFSPVLPNDGPLHLADGPWTDGVQGFTNHVRVFDSPIHDSAHKSIYRNDRSIHRSLSTVAACEAVRSVNETSRRKTSSIHPAQQIAYWTQCMTQSGDKETDHLPRAIVTSTTGEDPTASALYNEAVRLRSMCDHSSWDLLTEAAELGDSRALHDVGTALVYGRLAFTDEACAKSKIDGVFVDVDSSTAHDILLTALRKKEWGAARALALMRTYAGASLDQLQTGLYHLAAAAGRKDAFMVLGRLYATGKGVPRADTEIAAYHYFHAASDASVAYHARGKQPLHEMNRLYDGIDKEDELRKGQLGDGDELIQYQKMRADKDGDVEAMANMGDLYYWGARGLARDHDQAYHYFNRAAERGHTSAQSAVAGMLLKGEGTKQDNASAVEWYEKAALKNHTRALNGLGFIYFHGSGGKEENKTRALEFFERAAANMEDGDSVFNAGYCHAHALGTARNITRASEYYEAAARKFGHFDAIHELGKLHWTGWDDRYGNSSAKSVPRDSAKAVTYLKAASEAGTWGASVRTGFEFFLAGQYERATVVYAEATEYGYGVATSNLAYLYDQKLLRVGDTASEQRALGQLRLASERNGDKEVLVRIGDFHYYGMGGLRSDAGEALKWYSRASAQGVDAGAYNVGHMHEYGLGVPTNYDRAERYYQRVLELAPPTALEKQVAIHIALLRLRMRRYIDSSPMAQRLAAPLLSAQHNTGAASLPSLPGKVEEDDEVWHLVSQVTSVAVALIAVSVGAWLVRRRHDPSV